MTSHLWLIGGNLANQAQVRQTVCWLLQSREAGMIFGLLDMARRYAERRLVKAISSFGEALDESSDEDLGRLLALVLHFRNDVRTTRGQDLLDPDAALRADPSLRQWIEREERLALRCGQPLVALSIRVWIHTLDSTVSPAARSAARRIWAVLDRGRDYLSAGAREWQDHTGMALQLAGRDRLPPDWVRVP